MHSSKKIWSVLLTAAVFLAVFQGLDLILYPCTFIRNDIHAVTEQTFDDIYVGTSHGKINIDPETMESVSGRTGHNLCVGGEYSIDVYYMLKLLLEKGKKPSRVVYEISPGYFTQEKEEGNNYLLFYHEFPLSAAKLEYFADAVAKCNFRTMLFPWYEYSLSYELTNMKDTVTKKLRGDYSADSLESETQKYHESGFVERYPVDASAFSMAGLKEFREEDVVPEVMEYLDKTVALCLDNDVEFVAVTTPVPADTLRAFSRGYEDMNTYFSEFFEEKGVRYLNFNSRAYYQMASHRLESFTDYDGHMHGDAAREFSMNLARILEM